MAELQHRCRRVVDLLTPQRQLRVESVVRLVSVEVSPRETLIATGFTVVKRNGGISSVERVVATASAEPGRRVRRQQRRLVFIHGLIAKVELDVAVSVVAAQLIAQLGQQRPADRIAADALQRFIVGRWSDCV